MKMRSLLAALLLCFANLPAYAQGVAGQPVQVQDPTTLSNKLKVNSDGSINVDQNGGSGGLPAGTNNIGRVGYAADVAGTGITTRPANTTTYTVNTAWANATSGATYGTFTGVCATNGGNVYVTDAGFLDEANQATKLQGVLYLFSAAPGTPISDNATFNIASADWANLKRVSIPFAFGNVVNQTSGSGGAQMVDVPVGGQLACAGGTTNIYYMIEVTNAYVPLSAEVLIPSLHVFATN
jgi:hypothetical protein